MHAIDNPRPLIERWQCHRCHRCQQTAWWEHWPSLLHSQHWSRLQHSIHMLTAWKICRCLNAKRSAQLLYPSGCIHSICYEKHGLNIWQGMWLNVRHLDRHCKHDGGEGTFVYRLNSPFCMHTSQRISIPKNYNPLWLIQADRCKDRSRTDRATSMLLFWYTKMETADPTQPHHSDTGCKIVRY